MMVASDVEAVVKILCLRDSFLRLDAAAVARIHQNDSVFYPRRERRDTGRQRRANRQAGIEIKSPAVQRTNHDSAGNDAIAQRTALMRALVFDGREPIAKVENG